MITVAVGSQNPVKLSAVNRAFSSCGFTPQVKGYHVLSGVPPQPVGEQTMQGARNRVANLMASGVSADYYVAVEGGIINLFTAWFGFGCAAVSSAGGQTGMGTSALFPLPAAVVSRLLTGEELGAVIDSLSGQHNTKQHGGAIGYLTNGVITRDELYVQGIVAALIPHRLANLFRE